MSYQALYRKFRPQTFEEVRGQDAIVTTLKNQIKTDRVGHAYIFCGTRGTGKTTIAKLFAKAVNCENPQDGSPCGECQSCKNIAAGISMNVVEMDAASNNGVDDVRRIVDEVSYSPTEGKFRVYIVDEAHMLTREAANAFLKTLEEPPSYVKFILATTDPNRLPITIRSRCQRYDFRRIDIDTIAGRMRELVDVEQIAVEDSALKYIARCADGSMRDALSLLDQCIAFNLGEELTYDRTLEVLGAVDNDIFSAMLRMILEKDVTSSIHLLEEVVMRGRELSQFVTDFVWYLRNLMLVKTAENIDDVIGVSTEHRRLLQEESKMVDTATVMRYIKVLSELSGQLKFATQKRVLIEMTLIKLCVPESDVSLDGFVQRLVELETKVANGITVVSASAAGAAVQASGEAADYEKAPLPKAVPAEIAQIAGEWMKVVHAVDGISKSFLKLSSRPSVINDRLVVAFTNRQAVDWFKGDTGKEELKEALGQLTGKDMDFEAVFEEEGRVGAEYPVLDETSLQSIIAFDVVSEDDVPEDEPEIAENEYYQPAEGETVPETGYDYSQEMETQALADYEAYQVEEPQITAQFADDDDDDDDREEFLEEDEMDDQ